MRKRSNDIEGQKRFLKSKRKKDQVTLTRSKDIEVQRQIEERRPMKFKEHKI